MDRGLLWLNPGTSPTLYLNAAGIVEYVFVGGGTSSSAAVVIYADRSTEGFASLAGSSNYKIYKNGASASGDDMRQYDVATYSSATNSIRVCDTKLTVYYRSASPSPQGAGDHHGAGRPEAERASHRP